MQMIKFLQRINKTFDSIPEPYRFYLFMMMFGSAIIAQAAGLHFEIWSLYFGSWVYLLLMLTVRVLYIHGSFKSGKPNDE